LNEPAKFYNIRSGISIYLSPFLVLSRERKLLI